MTTKFHAPDDVVSQSVATVTCTFKVLISDELAHGLDLLYPTALACARTMLKNRSKSSSKYWPQLPCVVSKSLIAKYQRNKKCRAISRLSIPICGDKGKQVKRVEGGLRVPALFKKAIIPCQFPLPISGFIRQVEFFRRSGQWYMSYCYNTPCAAPIQSQGCVGVDRNMRGNVAVLADPQNGKVRHFGFCASRTKACWRRRKARLQRDGKRRLLHRLRRKQSRRTTYENHRVSKGIVDYAATHCRAIALEKLDGIAGDKSKCRRIVQKGQWAFAQLDSFIRYKAALRGVPVLTVSPAYTSQTCSRCGKLHKPDGKLFVCPDCGHCDHRDANAAFNIAALGLGANPMGVRVPVGGLIGEAESGKVGQTYA